jgi:AraC-like DNA-binding protein
MLPGNTYQFLPVDDKPVKHFWADFYGARAERMLKCIAQRIPAGTLAIVGPIEFEMIFEEMIKIYRHSPLSRRYEAVVSLERLMGLIYSSTLDTEAKDIKYDFIADMADEIKFSPLRGYDFRAKAKQNSLSYDHFRNLFKKYNGMAPYDYLLRCRMEHAAKTLKDDEISIKELASLSGFDDISSFSRMFKRKMGVSPAKYLTMHKRK